MKKEKMLILKQVSSFLPSFSAPHLLLFHLPSHPILSVNQSKKLSVEFLRE